MSDHPDHAKKAAAHLGYAARVSPDTINNAGTEAIIDALTGIGYALLAAVDVITSLQRDVQSHQMTTIETAREIRDEIRAASRQPLDH